MPKEASKVRNVLIDVAAELHDLLRDLLDLLLHGGVRSSCVLDRRHVILPLWLTPDMMISLQPITRFQITSIVPKNDQISYGVTVNQAAFDECPSGYEDAYFA